MIRVRFEELSAQKRAGGIDFAVGELVRHLAGQDVVVSRSSQGAANWVPDVVHVHGIWSPWLGLRQLRWIMRGVPCVVSPHGMLDQWALGVKSLRKRCALRIYQRWLLNRAATLHGTSLREVRQFAALGLRASSALVPWGVELPPLSGGPKESHGERTALFLGRIAPVKGLPLLIEAWGRARPKGWRLLVVGPDEAGHLAEVVGLVRRLGLEGTVEFTGELRASLKMAAFERSELFLAPSYTENFGMAIAEALAHALPVVTTTAVPWEQLCAENCGWRVPATVEAVASAISDATALAPPALKSMGWRGRRLVERDFDWKKAASCLGAIYSRVGRVKVSGD